MNHPLSVCMTAKIAIRAILLSGSLLFTSSTMYAQTTQFTYQGQLTDGGNPANGSYDLQFKLFDALNGGVQIGPTVTFPVVAVSAGSFSVVLEFGAAAFPGAARFLEIGVRPAGSANSYTVLSPRQSITSTPYAIRSLAATAADSLSGDCVNCVTSSQIASLPAGSGNYIQNSTTPQAASNFNISGNGLIGGNAGIGTTTPGFKLDVAGTINTSTQYNLGGNRILSTPGVNNLFAGTGAGQANTTGESNSFLGPNAGALNTTGGFNSFFGGQAGQFNTTGSANVFFGVKAGGFNTTGSNNTMIGAGADVVAGNLTFATAIGAGAKVVASNTIVLGRTGGLDAVNVPGLLTANGAGVTNLNAANITTGTLGTARGGTGLTAAGTAGNYLRSDGTNWTSSALQAADLPTGSGSYIQNTTTAQAASNFNISGDGLIGGNAGIGTTTPGFKLDVAGTINTSEQYNLAGNRILSASGINNLFAGAGAGQANTTGSGNSFFGPGAGYRNTTGSINSFFGWNAGILNTTGSANSFFGQAAGLFNTIGFNNSFFGVQAGLQNTTGSHNSLFGIDAGQANTTGNNNSFFGAAAGYSTTIGSNNSFFGRDAGILNTTGYYNSFFGQAAGFTNTTGFDNAFFGQEAGNANTTGDGNSFIGVRAGYTSTTGAGNTFVGAVADFSNTPFSLSPGAGNANTYLGLGAGGASARQNSTAIGAGAFVACDACLVLGATNVNVGIGTTTPSDKLHVAGDIRIGTGEVGCVKDADGTVIAGACSSDLRFKRNITPFPNLLDKLTRLHPVHFYWRQSEFPTRHFGARQSYGLIAQEVEQVLPELVKEDAQGFKAVDYAKLPLLLLQSVKELKAENEALRQQQTRLAAQQQQQLKHQQAEIEALKRLVCLSHPQAAVCRASRPTDQR